jgi:2-amino-4-hydroxy-6-hydroxymethyldihydropteridine diphosphokinase
MVKAYIGLGSNLGRPLDNLQRSLEHLEKSGQVRITKVSSVYLTEPVGYADQDWFHNAVAEVETALPAEKLLELLQEVEAGLGRERIIRWGPRTVDLDILCYGDEKINTEELQVPHPRMTERAFVLAPLAEIAGGLVLTNGLTVNETLKYLDDCKKFVCIQQKIW